MNSISKVLSIVTLLSFGLFISACDKKPTEGAQAEKVSKGGDEKGHKDDGHAHAEKKGATKVTLAKTGTKFDPSIKPEDLPDGAWACEMGGKVHYARLEKGDGKCEVCKMNLSEHHGENRKHEHEKGHDEKEHGDHKH